MDWTLNQKLIAIIDWYSILIDSNPLNIQTLQSKPYTINSYSKSLIGRKFNKKEY